MTATTLEQPNYQQVSGGIEQQARPDEGDWKNLAGAAAGVIVTNGCAVTATGSGLQIAVASGTCRPGGKPVAVTAGNVTADAADGTNPRIDLVVVDTNGTKSILKGTAVAVTADGGPEWPSSYDPDSHQVLARLDITASLATLSSTQIVDKRMMASSHKRADLLSPGTGIVDGAANVATEFATIWALGGRWWAPQATYNLTAAAAVTLTSDATNPETFDLLLHRNARVIGGSALTSGSMIDFDTSTTSGHEPPDVIIEGGKWSNQAVPNSTVFNQESVGIGNLGTAATAAIIDFRDGIFGSIVIRNAVFTSRSFRDYKDPAVNHWMGNPSTGETAGGDGHLFFNNRGNIQVYGCVFIGARGTGIYVSGQGDLEGTGSDGDGPPTTLNVHDNEFFWCARDISIKDGVETATVHHCESYGCNQSYVSDNRPNPRSGAVKTTFSHCVSRGYDIAFLCDEGTDVTYDNCKAYDGGQVAYNGDSRWVTGTYTLDNTVNSGSVTSIDVGGTELLPAAGPVSFTTDNETTCKAIATAINDDFGTSGWWAIARESGTDWEVHFQAAGAGLQGDTITITDTFGAGATEDATVDWVYARPWAFAVTGSIRTKITSPRIVGTEADWDTNRSTNRPQAFRIAGSGGETCEDTVITDVYVDDVGLVGGEYTTGGQSDPVRTRVDGLLIGDAMTSTAGFLIVDEGGSAVDYGHEMTRVVTGSDWESQLNDTGLDADNRVDGFEWDLQADGVYSIDGIAIISVFDDVDWKAHFENLNASDGGYWNILGPLHSVGVTGDYTSKSTVFDGEEIDDPVNGRAGSATEAVGIFPIMGTLVVDDDVTTYFQVAQRSAVGDVGHEVKVKIGTRITIKRIG